MEFRLLDSGLRLTDDRLQHAWYRLERPGQGSIIRVVILRELAYLPVEAREDPDLLGKQWAALRGLYNGGVDFLYAAAGFFAPRHIGVVQFYGAAAEDPSEEVALAEAARRMAAVEAVLANYPFSRLQPPNGERLQLLLERMERLPRLLAILGHPDPRTARRGLGRDGSLGQEDEELASQQGEILLRGLAKLQEDFVFLVTAAHVGRGALAAALTRMARRAGEYASRQRGSLNVGFSIALPLAAALGDVYGESRGRSDAAVHSRSRVHTESWGEGESRSWGHTVSRSESHGYAHTESTTVTDSVATGRTLSQGTGTADTTGRAHTESTAHTESYGRSVGVSEGQSWGVTTTEGRSHTTSVGSSSTVGHSQGQSSSWSAGASHAVSTGATVSASQTVGASAGSSHGVTAGQSVGHSLSVGQNVGRSVEIGQGANRSQGHSTSHTDSGSTTLGANAGVNAGVNGAIGIPGVASVGGNLGGSLGGNASTTTGSADTVGTSYNVGSSLSMSQGVNVGSSLNRGVDVSVSTGESATVSRAVNHAASTGVAHSASQTTGSSYGVGGSLSSAESTAHSTSVTTATGSFSSTSRSVGGFRSVTQSESWGQADTRGQADTTSQAHTVSRSRGMADSVVTGHAVSRGAADTESWAESVGEAWSEGRAVSRSHAWGRSQAQGEAVGQTLALAGSRSFAGGFSAGLVPGVSLGRSWQTEDDLAIRLTEVARGLESLLNQASVEGGFMTTALLFTGEGGERAAAALVPQAFHGPTVPTPVLTVAGGPELRLHGLAFRPSLEPEADPFGVGLLWSRWGTLLTPGQLAAYTAPNLFEEGTAVTVQERLPPLAFYAELPGEVVLGHLVSPETGELTQVPLRLSRERHFHTAFCGDTGYGKSVAAERMVYETTLHWKLKTIVLDFGAGWRKLLNAPGLEGRVEIRQLSPGGVRPLRWNPLQIGRHILPEVQWRAFCDIFGSIAQLGQKRQIHELREALRQVYLEAGVLVDDPECRRHPVWGRVRAEEAALIGAAEGTPLAGLDPEARQRLAVHRSRWVGLAELYGKIQEKLAGVPPRDAMLRGVLEGLLFRLHPLVQGAAATQYAAGPDAVDINEVVPGEWGVAVLEGGAFLDDFSKAFLLGWAAWHLYTDAVILRIRRGAGRPAHLQIVFEEANKILAGLERSGGEEGGGVSTAEQFASMWRDSRKYGIWLHLITQSPSEIPPGILSSCNNLFVAQLKNPRDRDLVIAALHRSEKGFVDEIWRRFLASLPVARAVAKLGYSFERAELEPCYIQPLRLDAAEPGDAEILARLGGGT